MWVAIGVLIASGCAWLVARYAGPAIRRWSLLGLFGEGAAVPPKATLLPSDVVVDRQLSGENDVDLFAYREIADRVAELVAGATHPVHVGVFGAWGAGKSSFLTLVQLRLAKLAGARMRPGLPRTRRFLVVRYDAWRYGGQALRRDLIAVAAKELKVKRRRYRAGLFESRQVVRLEMNEFVRRVVSFLTGVAVLLGGLAALAGIAAFGLWAFSWFAHGAKPPTELVADLDVDWSKVVAWLSAGLAILSAPNLLGVTVNRSSPSQDDEFARNLKALIREAEVVRPLRFISRWTPLVDRLPIWCRRRVVFFIDELDRAADAEVLNTLTALQTQFADANVSVIVAADRDVIEKALENPDAQRRPERTWDPYLSGPDSFLDKVFQHTFVLPPLRTERITEFARQLVSDGDGLWDQIAAEGQTDHVLYALIPSHVHSPRRIKVLLNAYATQTRVAEARRVPVSSLRLQLAMWVVFQLEFPRFAADLKSEQTLRRVMLKKPEDLTGKLNRMWTMHRPVEEPEPSAPDSEWRDWSYRNLLHEYLETTNTFEDIPFELLFLESAGSAIGRFSEEVAYALDRADRMEPARVLDAIGDLDEESLERAIQFVADRSRIAISIGRDRAVRVMAGLIEQHSRERLGRAASAAIDAFRRYSPQHPVPPDAVVAQIRTYMEAAPADLPRLLDHVATRRDGPHVAVVADQLTIPSATNATVLGRLAGWFGDHMSPFTLAALTRSGKLEIIESCLAANPNSVLDALLATEARNASEDDETDTSDGHLAEESENSGDAEEDEETEDPGITTLELPEIGHLANSLSEAAATALTDALAGKIRGGERTSALATKLLESRSRGSAKGALAVAVIISEPEIEELDSWVQFAEVCDDEEAKANAAEALIASIHIDDHRRFEPAFQRAAQLATDSNRELIAEKTSTLLTRSPWTAGAEEDRSSFGTAVTRWMADVDLPNVSTVALSEARAALPLALDAKLKVEVLTNCVDLMDQNDLEDLDRLLRTIGRERESEAMPALRALTARLRLRRLGPHALEPIPPTVVGRMYLAHSAITETEVATGRTAMIDEWFAAPRTGKDVLALLRSAKHSFARQTAKWMPTVTPVQAANVWEHATRRHDPASVAAVTKAVQLDTTKVANRMREMASSNDADIRAKSLQFARFFPRGRADSERAVQEVAAQLVERGGDERRQAYRLLAEYQPKRLLPAVQDFILGAPKWFTRSKAEKDLQERVQKRTGPSSRD